MNEPFLLIITAIAILTSIVLAVRTRGTRQEPLEIVVVPTRSDLWAEGSSALDILEHMDEGIVILNDALNLRFVNLTARRSIGLDEGPLPARMPVAELTALARAAQLEKGPQTQAIEIFYPSRVLLKARASSLAEGGVLVLLRDISEEARIQNLRKEFVAHASHELRSPVAGLRTTAEAIGEAAKGGDFDSARRFSSALIGEIDRLARLVDDLLDLSRLEDGNKAPEEPCDLGEVARSVAANMNDLARDVGIELTTDVGGKLIVAGEASQLGLMVRNLIDNAIRYTPEGGHVWLDGHPEGNEIVITVKDDGMGIPLEAQSRIFERFYRVDRARSRDRGGTGLGLAIVKHVVELHRGRVEVASELGAGSTFTIHLPAFEPSRTETNASHRSATTTKELA